MKIRTGFVTNSSSSSFIISSDTYKNINDVYLLVRGIYKRLPLDAHKAMSEMIENKLFNPGDNYTKLYMNSPNKREINMILDKYDLTIYDVVSLISRDAPVWCMCETYEDYLRYSDENGQNVPFEIVDLTLTDIDAITDVSTYTEIVDWYNSSTIDDVLSRYVDGIDCKTCKFKGKCKQDTPIKCKKTVDDQYIENDSNFSRFAILEEGRTLGKFAIYGYENSIDFCVMKKLADESTEYCTHMG